MGNFGEIFQSADWKKEKHAPVIELPQRIKKGEKFRLQSALAKKYPIQILQKTTLHG